jgi:hypothetical protein
MYQALLTWFQDRRDRRWERRILKHHQREIERRTEGLLRIALQKRHNSVNSLTARDPGVYDRKGEGNEWMVQRRGGR